LASGPWVIYNEFKVAVGAKKIDLTADVFKVALLASTSNAGSAALATAQYATLTNELATANGYTAGGVTPGTPTYTQTAGTATFDIADASWTATGTLTARFAVLYDFTATNKDLVAYMLLDSTPADVVVSTGNTLTIQIANVFTLV
jgi:hypothetical protein